MATDLKARLLAYAHAQHGTKASAMLYGDEFVRVDDAAACMAEREAKLRAALEIARPFVVQYGDLREMALVDDALDGTDKRAWERQQAEADTLARIDDAATQDALRQEAENG